MTTKHLRITYWIVTLLFASLQAWSAFSYLVEAPRMTATITGLGYPIYFMKLLGVAKLCGIAAILYGGFPTLKEWAYAGFTFDTVGAFWSHAAHGDGVLVASVPLVFLAVQLVSYFLWKRLSAQPAESRRAARLPAPPGSSPQSRPRVARAGSRSGSPRVGAERGDGCGARPGRYSALARGRSCRSSSA
jgi:hypothetical protein